MPVDARTEEMGFEPLGLHQGCGGEVRLLLTRRGGTRLCLQCGDAGPDCLEINPLADIRIDEQEVERE